MCEARDMNPRILTYPGLGAFNTLFSAQYEPLSLPQDATERSAFLAVQGAGIEAAVVIGSRGLPEGAFEALPDLKLIACFGVGYDGVDLETANRRGVAVTNCPNINHEDVADTAMGLLLSCVRHIAAGDRAVRAGAWKGAMAFPPPRRLKARKLGIVGLGAIGQALGVRAQACGLEIGWCGPRPKDTPWRREPDLLSLARWSDILALALRPDPGTDRMVNAAVLEALGPEGVVINVSRGSVIDEDALIAALREGRIAGAGLDVFAVEPTPAERWADIPSVTLTPHLGGGTRESILESAQLVLENLRRHYAGEALATRVN